MVLYWFCEKGGGFHIYEGVSYRKGSCMQDFDILECVGQWLDQIRADIRMTFLQIKKGNGMNKPITKLACNLSESLQLIQNLTTFVFFVHTPACRSHVHNVDLTKLNCPSADKNNTAWHCEKVFEDLLQFVGGLLSLSIVWNGNDECLLTCDHRNARKGCGVTKAGKPPTLQLRKIDVECESYDECSEA